jgi:hypothetical protein
MSIFDFFPNYSLIEQSNFCNIYEIFNKRYLIFSDKTNNGVLSCYCMQLDSLVTYDELNMLLMPINGFYYTFSEHITLAEAKKYCKKITDKKTDDDEFLEYCGFYKVQKSSVSALLLNNRKKGINICYYSDDDICYYSGTGYGTKFIDAANKNSNKLAYINNIIPAKAYFKNEPCFEYNILIASPMIIYSEINQYKKKLECIEEIYLFKSDRNAILEAFRLFCVIAIIDGAQILSYSANEDGCNLLFRKTNSLEFAKLHKLSCQFIIAGADIDKNLINNDFLFPVYVDEFCELSFTPLSLFIEAFFASLSSYFCKKTFKFI